MAIRTEIGDDGIAVVTLARGERRNALTTAMLVELERVADSFREAGDVRAVVLCSDGPDFSVGMDLAEMEAARPPAEVLRRIARQGMRTMRAWMEIDQPTVCALAGIATGGGACLATACDFRVASPDLRLGYGEVKLGINLMWHALGPLVALIGPARAKRLVLRGDLVPADRLADWGLVDEVSESPLSAARAMAQAYAALPPIAVQMVKRSVNALAHALSAPVLHADTDQWLLATTMPEHRAALAAFRTRRKPARDA